GGNAPPAPNIESQTQMSTSSSAGGIQSSSQRSTGTGAGATAGSFSSSRVNSSTGGDIQVQDNASANDETFKNLIRALYPRASDTVRTVNFQRFSSSGPANFEAKYAGHIKQGTQLGGHGHVYKSYKVQTKYEVLTHYQDPLAPDQVASYEG